MPILGVIASSAKGQGSAWTLLSTSYIGNFYSNNYGFGSTGVVTGPTTPVWHRVNPQSSSSGYHNVWDGSTWNAKTIFSVSPGREIFGYGGANIDASGGYFYITGGQATGSSTALSTHYGYQDSNNTWFTGNTLPSARRYLGTLVGGGYTTEKDVIYGIGGVGTSTGSSTIVYNTNFQLTGSSGSWNTRATHPLNYEWYSANPHTRGVTGNVSTYRVHTVGGYSAPDGTYATEAYTTAHYAYQNSSNSWTAYTAFPSATAVGTSTAENIAGTADRIYTWEGSTNVCYTWDGSNWTTQSSAFTPPSAISYVSGAQPGTYIDSTKKVIFNSNFEWFVLCKQSYINERKKMAKQYVFESKKEGENWVAYVSIDGAASLRQEHDHKKFGIQNFTSKAEADAWAQDWINTELAFAEKAEIGALAIKADEELDRAFKEATILQTMIMLENN